MEKGRLNRNIENYEEIMKKEYRNLENYEEITEKGRWNKNIEI